MAINRKWKIITALSTIGFVIFYIEILSGLLKTREWTKFTDVSGRTFDRPNLEKDEALRILLVADPQIIGEKNEMKFIGPFSRWDSDTYLRKYYKLARDHVQPHIVAFLGDLFDEGLEANDAEYRRYAERFTDIFELPNKSDPSDMEYIFLPGDNDVGGEKESISPVKLRWFNLTFDNFEEPFWLRKNGWNIQFLKIWSVAFYSQGAHEKFLQKISNMSKDEFDGFRIILSHFPYWKYSSRQFREMVTQLKTTLIFSGNDHKSSLIVFDEDSYQHKSTQNFQLIPNVTGQVHPPFFRIDLKKTSDKKVGLSEIMVPTCSYRMGMPNMGFGAFQLYKNGTLNYTVLWLPSRYSQLKLYLGGYILWKFLFTPWILWKIYCFIVNKYRRKQGKGDKYSV